MFRLAVILVVLCGSRSWAAERTFPLESVAGLKPHHVAAEATTHDGRKGVRVTASEAPETLAVVEGTLFGSGVIEAEIAGAVQAGAPEGARGFVGIAFRVQDDLRTYDAFYLRPTNGRAEDQVRRNRSAQYISHPDWTWSRLRQEAPGKYEAYVDLVPGAWTKVRIEVDGVKARFYVHDQPQPTLVVGDLKTGPSAKGAVALWVDVGTLAHFRNLKVTPADR